MHRAITAFLLAVISLPLIVAAVCGDELSHSPACCRRDGQHHCKMAGTESPSDGPVVAPARCQSWPAIALLDLNTPLPAALAETGLLWLSCPAAYISHQRPFCAMEGLTKKRGPPILLD